MGTPHEAQKSRLRHVFAGWLADEAIPDEFFFTDGLIVLDANVLLDLYRITPRSSADVLSVLKKVQKRLWLPHQAAYEFSRNLEAVLRSRQGEFGQTRTALKRSVGGALDGIDSAIDKLVAFREDRRATRRWKREDVALNRNQIREQLEEILKPALSELSRLEQEYDYSINSSGNDRLISDIDNLIGHRIGPKFSNSDLQKHVAYALNFRYPNKIPPGFRDIEKETQLLAAGDYLMWRQIINHLNHVPPSHPKPKLVMIVTGDQKNDWWAMDRHGKPTAPLTELVQELWDTAGAHLHLVSIQDLLAGARRYLATDVADDTIFELQEVDNKARITDLLGAIDGPVNLLDLSPLDYERVAIYVLTNTGFKMARWREYQRPGLDAVATAEDGSLLAVKIKKGRCNSTDMQRFITVIRASDFVGGIFVARTFAMDAASFAAGKNVQLVDALQLVVQLTKLGIKAETGPGDSDWRPKDRSQLEHRMEVDETDSLARGEISDDELDDLEDTAE